MIRIFLKYLFNLVDCLGSLIIFEKWKGDLLVKIGNYLENYEVLVRLLVFFIVLRVSYVECSKNFR